MQRDDDCPEPRSRLREIERAAVLSWPALETQIIDGWMARFSSGGSVRANTVSALHYDGRDVEASIAKATTFYRDRGGPARFTLTEVDAPQNLDAILAGQGWLRHGDHVTMAKTLGAEPDDGGPSVEIEIHDAPTDEWMAVYLSGLSDSRRAVAPRIVAGVPTPRAFLSLRRNGTVIASGLTVHEGDLASVQCMATLPEARRTGAARAILGTIERIARGRQCRILYLQTDLSNLAATSLYGSVGFQEAGRYHVRELQS